MNLRETIILFRRDATSMLLLTVLAALALYPVFLRGDVPIAASSVLDFAPWQAARSLEDATDAAPSPGAEALVYYPAYVFMQAALERGDSLLWNPLEFGGVPFFAQWRTRCLSPFSIPFHAFPVQTALAIAAFLKILVAGWCAYYAARRLGILPSFALLVGVGYQLSAPMLVGIGQPMSDVLPWLPLLLLFVERMALGQIRYWPSGALVIALMLLGGEPWIVVGTIVFSSVYLAIRLSTRRKTTPLAPPIVLFSISVLVGIMLCGVQIVPYIELLQHSVSNEVADTMNPSPMVMLHIGFVPIFLAGLWCAQRSSIAIPHRRRVDTLLLTSGIFLFISIGWLGLGSVVALPASLIPGALLAAVTLSMLLAGAATAEAWLDLDADQCTYAFKRFVTLAPICMVLILIPALGPLRHSGDSRIGIDGVFFSILLLILFFAVLGRSLFKPSTRTMGYGLAAVAALDLFFSFRPLVNYTEAALLFPKTSFIESLEQNEGRIGGSAGVAEWPLAGNRIAQTHGTGSFVLRRYDAFIRQSRSDPLLLGRAACNTLLLTKEDIRGAFARIRPMLHVREVFDSGAVLFETLDTGRRARIEHAVRTVEQFDRNALDSSLPPLVETALHLSSSEEATTWPHILGTKTNISTPVDVSRSGHGILVMADAYYPGWKATVDENPAEVFPVDGAFRGVFVPQGTRTVTIFYDPASLKIGLGITIVATLLVLGGYVHLLLWQLLNPAARPWPESGEA
ncbi:MAG: YfhO family protein [Candidatus Hydrogenedentes bacterium]|nr:YfhO family protein [Candidatus Hydrogenedentota bacterium]